MILPSTVFSKVPLCSSKASPVIIYSVSLGSCTILTKVSPCIVAYLIDDTKVEGYDGSLFYGKNMSEEKHYITNTGDVITLPGLKVVGSDGTITYHISNLYSYTLEEGEKPITLKEKYGLDVNGNIID